VAKRVGPNGPARQPVLKGTGLKISTRQSVLARPVQPVNLTGQSTGQPVLVRWPVLKK